jgi:hypothetical protein
MWKKKYFYLWDLQRGISCLHREMEKGLLCKIEWGEENLSLTEHEPLKVVTFNLHTE